MLYTHDQDDSKGSDDTIIYNQHDHHNNVIKVIGIYTCYTHDTHPIYMVYHGIYLHDLFMLMLYGHDGLIT